MKTVTRRLELRRHFTVRHIPYCYLKVDVEVIFILFNSTFHRQLIQEVKNYHFDTDSLNNNIKAFFYFYKNGEILYPAYSLLSDQYYTIHKRGRVVEIQGFINENYNVIPSVTIRIRYWFWKRNHRTLVWMFVGWNSLNHRKWIIFDKWNAF